MSNIEEETFTATKDWSLESIEAYIKDLEQHKKLIELRLAGARRAQGEAIDRLAEENQK